MAHIFQRYVTIIVLCGSLGVAFEGSSMAAELSPAELLNQIDKGGDGTINPSEAKAAAAAVIVNIDSNHDGVLTNAELGGRVMVVDKLSPSARHPLMFWKTEGTLTKQEYLNLVDERFEPATKDDDGTVDVKELETESGQALLQLLQ
jgi:Ca2+-binding EF-hand superfamily protein